MDLTDWQHMLTVTGRLALAMLLGGLVGLERQVQSQAAGLRTHMIVSLGSCLIMIVSVAMRDMERAVNPNAPNLPDPGRIAAQVVAGIGFLGAGAIMRHGVTVRGLTTAAGLWCVAGVGLACGVGLYWEASVASAFILIITYVFDKIEKQFLTGKSFRNLQVTARDTPGVVGNLERVLEANGVEIKSVGITKLVADQKVQLHGMVKIPENIDLEKLSRQISTLPDVEQFEVD